MSEAPPLIASSRILVTYFTTGASSISSVATASVGVSASVTSIPERSTSSVTMSMAFAEESVSFLTTFSSLSSSTTTGSMVSPVANFTSCSTCSLDGSDIATNTRLPRLPSATMRWLVTSFVSISASGRWSRSTAFRSSSG